MPVQTPQAELFHPDYNEDPKDWLPAKILLAEIEKELAERRVHLLRRLSSWYLALKILKDLEDRRMVLQSPTSRDLQYHKAFSRFLQGVGEILLLELQQHTEIDPESIGIKFEDVAASVEALRYNIEMWHSDMTEIRRGEILSNVFSEQK